MYADFEYYTTEYKGKMDEETANKALKQASRHIDSLTFNRAVNKPLTEFQSNILKEVCCMMADFENENGEMINSLINSYSLNGASISFGGTAANCTMIGGVVVQKDVYAYLCQTGLTCRSLGV